MHGRGVISKNSAPVGSVYDGPLSFSLSSVFDNNGGLSPFLATNKPGSTHYADSPSPQTGREPPGSFLYKTVGSEHQETFCIVFEISEPLHASY